MTEQTDTSSGHGSGQGRDAVADTEGAASGPVRSEGERMARKLVQDVAAYEVDPPPPSRVTEAVERPGDSGETSSPA